MERDKRLKFVELAELRVNKALNFMRLIENLANKKNYDYTESDANQVIGALEDALRSVKASFKEDSSSTKNTFRLKK